MTQLRTDAPTVFVSIRPLDIGSDHFREIYFNVVIAKWRSLASEDSGFRPFQVKSVNFEAYP